MTIAKDPTKIDHKGLPPVVATQGAGIVFDGLMTQEQLATLKSRMGCTELQPDVAAVNPPPADSLTDERKDALRVTFDRVVCINLATREDRWADLQLRLADAEWPFLTPERFEAVDGTQVTPPAWWKGRGRGAWGCRESHIRVLKAALADGVQRLLVLEDDVMFTDDFPARAAQFLDALPDGPLEGWDMLYFGCQHLHQDTQVPQRVNDMVLRVLNGHRTHNYAVSARFLPRLIEHLERTDWRPKHHVDHRIGLLHSDINVQCYAPSRNLIGQAGGKSDVGKDLGPMMWNTPAVKLDVPEAPPPMVITQDRVEAGDIVLIKAYRGKVGAIDPLRRHAEARGCRLHVISPTESWQDGKRMPRAIAQASLCVIWHGLEPGTEIAKEAAENVGTPYCYAENGLLPQRGHWQLDPGGIQHRSSLMGPLDWVTDEDYTRYYELLATLGDRWGGDLAGPVVVPLQMEHDASIIYGSPWSTMQAFVEHVRGIVDPDTEIVVTPHPRQRRQALNVSALENVRIDRHASTVNLARSASRVIGINSTVLYETAALGVPTEALGRCPLAQHVEHEDRTRLLVAASARQIPLGISDITPWLTRMGIVEKGVGDA